MNSLTRRKFLIASTGTAALAGAAVVSLPELHRRAKTDALPAGTGVLVIVTLYGGNDGLNTVVPYADPAYHDARPELAYRADQVHKVSNDLGLNPALAKLATRYQSNQVAIVRGVGYPKPSHSHFQSMDIWQTASPETPVHTGWIGRWLDATGDDPVRALSVGSVLPPLAVGAKSTAAALPLSSSPLAANFAGLGTSDASDGPAAALVCASYRAERQAAATFKDVDGDDQTLKAQLALVSKCIAANVPTRVYSVSLGGFDTHAAEKAGQEVGLGLLDSALEGFLATAPENVTVLVYSEFGRRVQGNASQGTDHGTAGPVFVLGKKVKGGLYGEQPSLTDLDNGDLKSNVDFRTVYAEMLAGVLGTDPARVLGQDQPRLGLLTG